MTNSTLYPHVSSQCDKKSCVPKNWNKPLTALLWSELELKEWDSAVRQWDSQARFIRIQFRNPGEEREYISQICCHSYNMICALLFAHLLGLCQAGRLNLFM